MVIHYLKYYSIKNLRKGHREHDLMSSRCSLVTTANTCFTHLVVSQRLQTQSEGRKKGTNALPNECNTALEVKSSPGQPENSERVRESMAVKVKRE